MRGRKLEKTGNVFAAILQYVEEFFGPRTTQMPADRLRSSVAYSDRLLGYRRFYARSSSFNFEGKLG